MANDPRLEAAVRAAEAGFYQALRCLYEDGVEPLLAHWSAAEAVTAMNAAGGYECGAAAVAGRWAWWQAQGRPMPPRRRRTACRTRTMARPVATSSPDPMRPARTRARHHLEAPWPEPRERTAPRRAAAIARPSPKRLWTASS